LNYTIAARWRAWFRATDCEQPAPRSHLRGSAVCDV
jgi:hypothetical protein